MIVLNNQFSNIAESGENYIKFSDGTLICYGYISIPSGSASTTITLPCSFANDWEYFVNITNQYSYSNDCTWSTSSLYKNTFKAYVTAIKTSNVERNASWMAIGKWK